MTTRLYLIRHGETIWNRENRTQGWTDIELNAQGLRHAAAIGSALKDVPLRAVYASSLIRAIATARAIAGWHNLDVLSDPDLRELHQGDLDGLTTQELRRDHAAFLEQWRVAAAPLRMPGGESMLDLQARAWAAIQRIVAAHPDGNVAVVSHNLAIVTVLCRILELDLNSFRRLRQDVAAINLLEFGGPFGPTMIRVNETAHLGVGAHVAAGVGRLVDSTEFGPQAVPEEDLHRILGAAAGAGVPAGCCHTVVFAAEAARRRLSGALRTALLAADCDPALTSFLESAPVVLAVLASQNDTALGGRVGAVIQSLRIAGQALGYGSAWLDGVWCENAGLRSALDVPAGWRLAALLPLGVRSEPQTKADSSVERTYTILDS